MARGDCCPYLAHVFHWLRRALPQERFWLSRWSWLRPLSISLNKTPYRIHLSVPHMGGTELAFVQSAFETNWLSTVGRNLSILEEEFSRLMTLPCVALASGTAGLHLGLKLLGVGPGDEVVTPTLTFAASANPILYERAVPVFVDSESASWNLDPNLLAE